MEIFSYSSGILKVLDLRKLPFSAEYIICKNYKETIAAIKAMAVRGAPAISIAAAYAVVQAAEAGADVGNAAEEIMSARPTAVDLSNAVHYMLSGISEEKAPEELARA